jgi:ShK domain-like
MYNHDDDRPVVQTSYAFVSTMTKMRNRETIQTIRNLQLIALLSICSMMHVDIVQATPSTIVDTTEYLARAAATHKLGECFPSSTDERKFHCFAKLRAIATATGISDKMNTSTTPSSTPTTTPKYVHNDDDDDDCYDNEDNECPKWAESGECTINPNYMLVNCRYSCQVCFDVVDGHGGTIQIAPDSYDFRQRFVHHITDTAQYIRNIRKQYPKVRATCRNYKSECTHDAVKGQCVDTQTASYMLEHCPAACRSCV